MVLRDLRADDDDSDVDIDNNDNFFGGDDEGGGYHAVPVFVLPNPWGRAQKTQPWKTLSLCHPHPFTIKSGTPLENSLLIITGGYRGHGYLSETEVYPKSTSGCSPPPLPLARSGHTTFVTSQPSALVAACGGCTNGGTTIGGNMGTFTSCLLLDPINQRWDENRMGNLTMVRIDAAAATLDDIGVFIVGGTMPTLEGPVSF